MRRSLSGTRDAVARLEAYVAAQVQTLGFVRGRSNACTFAHPQRGLRRIVIGDDLFTLASVTSWLGYARSWKKVVLLKVVGVFGSGKDDQK